MGFLRQYGIIIAIIGTIAVLGWVWAIRGNYDSGKTVMETEKNVEPIRLHEEKIGNNPLSGSQLLNSLLRHQY